MTFKSTYYLLPELRESCSTVTSATFSAHCSLLTAYYPSVLSLWTFMHAEPPSPINPGTTALYAHKNSPE
jgi:hypothetical protein